MRVYGFTDDRKLRAIDLSLSELIEKGIDPWRIDLFDSCPVPIEAQSLLFTPLRSFSFAFECPVEPSRGHQLAYVGLVDSVGKPACVEGEIVSTRGGLVLDRLRPADFRSSMQVYLRSVLENDKPYAVWAPAAEGTVRWSSKQLHYASRRFADGRHLDRWLTSYFAGRALEKMSLRLRWHKTIEAVLTALRWAKPKVYGPGLVAQLQGKTPQVVDISLGSMFFLDAVADSLRHLCDPKEVSSAGFTVAGMRFRLDNIAYSPYDLGLTASASGDVEVSRLDLFELSRNRFRFKKRDQPLLTLPKKRSECQVAREFAGLAVSLVPDLLVDSLANEGVHCDPVVLKYVDLFRLATNINIGVQPSLTFNERLRVANSESCVRQQAMGTVLELEDIRKTYQDDDSQGLSTTFSQNILSRLVHRAKAGYEAGQRSQACFTSLDARKIIAKEVAASALPGQTRSSWLALLHTAFETGYRREMIRLYILASLVPDYQVRCGKIFSHYVSLTKRLRSDSGDAEARDFVDLVDSCSDVPLERQGELRRLAASMDDETVKQYCKGGIFFSHFGDARLASAINRLVFFDAVQQGNIPHEGSEITELGKAHLVDALISEFDFCSYCGAQLVQEFQRDRTLVQFSRGARLLPPGLLSA